jgi:hypothetical protein
MVDDGCLALLLSFFLVTVAIMVGDDSSNNNNDRLASGTNFDPPLFSSIINS